MRRPRTIESGAVVVVASSSSIAFEAGGVEAAAAVDRCMARMGLAEELAAGGVVGEEGRAAACKRQGRFTQEAPSGTKLSLGAARLARPLRIV